MIDDKSARIRLLLEKREEIDVELAAIFGALPEQPKRGRPRKDNPGNGSRADNEGSNSTAEGSEPSGMGESPT